MTVAPRQAGPHVWVGEELAADPESWTWRLSDTEVDELLTASAGFADGDADLPSISTLEFPLPQVSRRLAELKHNLIRGRGFEAVLGWPVADVPVRQTAAVFLGIGAHLGSARSQNAAGHLLGHVRDVGLDIDDPDVRIYQTNERQTFHTDSADVVGLLCLETAKSGGRSLLVSAGTIYNEMLDREPALAALLFESVATDRRGEVPMGADPFFTIPVLNWYDDALTVMIQRQYIDSAQRLTNAPRLNLSLEMGASDMLFVHNHSLLHDRTEFTNKPNAPRHLLQLWLAIDGDRRLPPSFGQRYGDVTVGDRGGIVTSVTTPHAPLSPSA